MVLQIALEPTQGAGLDVVREEAEVDVVIG
jgi:hypothetical protein